MTNLSWSSGAQAAAKLINAKIDGNHDNRKYQEDIVWKKALRWLMIVYPSDEKRVSQASILPVKNIPVNFERVEPLRDVCSTINLE